jgi:hypothetical protein
MGLNQGAIGNTLGAHIGKKGKMKKKILLPNPRPPKLKKKTNQGTFDWYKWVVISSLPPICNPSFSFMGRVVKLWMSEICLQGHILSIIGGEHL